MPPGHMKGAAERVHAAGGLYIADEVQSGFGRTGEHFWGFQADDVVPDIVVMATGLGSGFPIVAVVASKDVSQPMAEKVMFHTYGANPTSAAAARAVLAVLCDEGLQENAAEVGAALLERLHDIKDKYSVIGDVRGKGLMLAIEMAREREAKTPDREAMTEIFEACRDQGIILSKSGQFQSCLRIVRPLCLTKVDVEHVAKGLNIACRQATQRKVR